MESKRYFKTLFFLLSTVLIGGCIKEVGFVEDFESALVVEAIVTNELKNQEVKLSRTFRFEEDGPNPETGAKVEVIGNNTTFTFEEISPGNYVSLNEFNAVPNINYTISIKTNNGLNYRSTSSQLTQVTQIDDLYAVRETNDDGVNGMSMYIDTHDPTGNAKFYRYEYQESYKIVAPRWVPQDAVIVGDTWPFCQTELVDKTEEKRVCFNVIESTKIIQASTSDLNDDRLSGFLIRFIDSESYWLTYRYSILVRQYVQSREAFRYTETLNNFNAEGSLFSQSQTGFFEGNIVSTESPNEKVIGFFEVSSISSARIFFDYVDYYPNEPVPPFPSGCAELFPSLILNGINGTPGRCGSLINGLLVNSIVFYEERPFNNRPYVMLDRRCGDCTALGSNIVPDFWVD